MYNFAQALSAGYVKLIDWKSIENAQMATVEFKKELIKTAVECGTLTKTSKGMYKTLSTNIKGKTFDLPIDETHNFNDSLSYQWMTTDVLIKTLNKYSDSTTKIGKKATYAATEVKTFTMMMDTLKEAAQSGWGYTQEYIFGDFNEAKKMWTEASKYFSNILDNSANARNQMFKEWHDMGGRNDLIQSFRNLAGAIESIVKPIKEAFREIFPKKTGKDLFELTKRLKDFTASLKINDETAAKIKDTFKGFFSILSTGLNIFKTLARGAWEIVKTLFGFSGNILDATSKVGNFFTKISEGIKQADFFNSVVNGMTKIIGSFTNSLKGFGGGFLSKLGDVIKTIATAIGGAISRIFKTISDAINSGDAAKAMDLLNKGLLSMVLLKLKKFINYLAKGGTFLDTLKGFVNSIKGVADSIAGVLDSVRKSLEVWQQNLKVKTLMKIATAIGILAFALLVLSDIPKDKLEAGLSAITTLFIDLVASLKILMAGKLDGGKRAMSLAIGLAISVNVLASALKKVATLDPEQLTKGIVAIFALVKIMTGAINKLAVHQGKAIKGAAGIIAMGIAIKILASAVEQLAAINFWAMAQGVGAVSILIGVLGAFVRFANTQNAKMISTGLGIILLGAGLKILANVCKDFASLSWGNCIKGVAAIGSLLQVLAHFVKHSSKDFKQMIIAGIALNIVAIALKQISKIILSLATLSFGDICKGIVAMGAALYMMVKTLLWVSGISQSFGPKFLDSFKIIFASMAVSGMVDALSKIAKAFLLFKGISFPDLVMGLIAIGASLFMLTKVMEKLKGQDPTGLIICSFGLMVLAKSVVILAKAGIFGVATGLIAFAGIFTILGVAAKLLKPHINTMFKLAQAILALSGSFAVLGLAMAALGAGLGIFTTTLIATFVGFKMLGVDTIIKGVFGLVIAFVALGAAAKLLAPMAKELLILAGVMVTFGLSIAAIGVGVSLIATALATMAAVGKEGAETAGLALKALIQHIIELIPVAVQQIGLGLIELLKIIKDSMPLIGDIVKETVLMLVDVLITCAPALAKGLFETIIQTLQMLVKYTPQIIDLLFQFLIQVLNKLSTKIPDFVVALFQFLSILFDACIQAFNKLDPEVFLKGVAALGGLLIAMHLLAGLVSITPMAMLGILAFGALLAELSLVLAAVGKLNQIPGLQELVNGGGNLLQAVGTAIGKFVGGIIGGIAKGISDNLPDIATNLSTFMQRMIPFIMIAQTVNDGVLKGASILALTILELTAADLINSIGTWITGADSFGRMGKMLSDFALNALPFIATISMVKPEALQGAKNLAEAVLAFTASNFLESLSTKFFGESDYGSFGEKLAVLAQGLSAFVNNLKGFDKKNLDTIEVACEGIKKLTEAAANMPKSGGLWQNLVGEVNPGSFGTQIAALGAGLVLFTRQLEIGNFNSGKIEIIRTACDVIKEFVNIAKTIPPEGGVWQKLAGEQDLGTFAKHFPQVGEGIAGFVNALTTDGGLSNDSVEKTKTAVSIMYAIATLGNYDLGNLANNLAGLGDKLTDFGIKIAGFIGGLNTVSKDEIIETSDKMDQIITLASKLTKVDFKVTNSFKDFSDKLANFGLNSIKGFIRSLTNVDLKTKAEVAIKTLLDSLKTVMSSYKGPFNTEGVALVGEAVKGLQDSGAIQKATQAGRDFGQGFINGIQEKRSTANIIAKDLGSFANKGLKIGIDSNSPSKITHKLGNFFGEGFVIGIKEYNNKVYSQSSDIAERAKDGLSRAIAGVSNLITNGIDDDITIRPILDLSDVQAGAASINGMFASPSIGVMSNLNAISSGMRSYRQNGGENVVDAIDRLGKNLGNTSGDTYHIDGITYDDGSNVASAVQTLIRAAKIERRK